jgi:subfamily B ATP-binding cassette protein MsbA
MLLVAGAYAWLVSPGLMLTSYLMAFGFVLLRILPLLNQLYVSQGHLIFALGGLKEVEMWAGTPAYPIQAFGSQVLKEVQEGLRFEGVSFRYPNGTLAVDDISFSLPKGGTVALMGASGSGKSTLVSLLLRFRRPTAGQILVDGIDHWDFSPESWHRQIAVVEQECFLFHDTIRNNVALGLAVTDEEIREALQTAYLWEEIKALPQGLATVVGERGAFFSGGQRQRLAIARALVQNPSLLILDEATSALDTVAESIVQEALEKAMRGRTVLIVAHRLSTIKRADWVVLLEGGRIIDQGTWKVMEAQSVSLQKYL